MSRSPWQTRIPATLLALAAAGVALTACTQPVAGTPVGAPSIATCLNGTLTDRSCAPQADSKWSAGQQVTLARIEAQRQGIEDKRAQCADMTKRADPGLFACNNEVNAALLNLLTITKQRADEARAKGEVVYADEMLRRAGMIVGGAK